MRVTQQMMTSSVLAGLNSLRARQAGLTQQISSGQSVSKPSDNPSASSEAMRIQSRLQLMGQWEANQADTHKWIRATENALSSMTEVLQRAREIAVAGASSPIGDMTASALAPEVAQLLDELRNTLNTQEGDGYLFAGFRTATEPFPPLNPVTGAASYAGGLDDIQRDVGPGVTLAANLHGGRLAADWTTPDNMLTTLWQLNQDLQNEQHGAAGQAITNIDQGLERVLALRAELGSREKRLDQLEGHLQTTYVQMTDLLEQAQGVEMEKAIMDLTSTETTYRAALQVGARVIPQTLADFLR